ncbi:MAG: ABC transporter permease, partial [bacterium]
MNKLHRKLFRDLSASKGLFLAVAVVVLLGVALFGASFLGYRNLKSSYDYTYEKLHFADFTIKVEAAPESAVEQLKSISGISEVTGRINYDLPISIAGEESKNVLGRVISMPSGSRPDVNDVKVEKGAYFEDGSTNSIMVEKSFAEYHDLNIGDTLYLIVDEKEISFSVTAIVTSPEYIWVSKSRQEIMPSLETFGVFFIPGDIAATIAGDVTINEFCFLTDEGADSTAMISEAQNILKPYGIMDTVPRDEQPSNAALNMDLQELSEMAEVFPLLFLIVGALATYMLLTRMVHNQRTQIGIMRAMGYSRRQILVHYLSFALIIGVFGATTGILAGYFLSMLLTKFYV